MICALCRLAMRVEHLRQVSTEGWPDGAASDFQARLSKLPAPKILREGLDISSEDARPWMKLADGLEGLVRHNDPRSPYRARG